MNWEWEICRAEPCDQQTVIDLIEDRADWIRKYKKTCQWDKPWPTREKRDERVAIGIRRKCTWIAWDGGIPAATATIYPEGDPALWTEAERQVGAVYLHRLVVHRNYRGNRMGAELINWAAKKGKQLNPRAEVIRVDVWTDNTELHAYYGHQGFEFVAVRTPNNYPSGALFEKPIKLSLDADTSHFHEKSV